MHDKRTGTNLCVLDLQWFQDSVDLPIVNKNVSYKQPLTQKLRCTQKKPYMASKATEQNTIDQNFKSLAQLLANVFIEKLFFDTIKRCLEHRLGFPRVTTCKNRSIYR